jgi:hypothetical protein
MNNNKVLTIPVVLSAALVLLTAILSLYTTQQQQQQQSFAQTETQELRAEEFSDWMDDRGYTVRLYEFRPDNGDLIIYAERTNRSVTAIPPSPAEID